MSRKPGVDRDEDEELVGGYLFLLSGRVWGVALGLLLGTGLFLVTNFLLLRGGANVGAHLGMLSNFLPYYDVSFVGSLIGFGYAFVIGYVIGRITAFVYNRFSGD